MSTALQITNNIIRYGGQIFQVHNITQVHVQHWKRKPKIRARWMVSLSVLVSVLCFLDPLLFERLSQSFLGTRPGLSAGAYQLAGLVGACVILYGIADRFKLNQYTLFFETNSGSNRLFTSRDKKGIYAIADAIASVMENRNVPVNYHVSVDQSKVVLGDEFSNIGANSTIVNRSRVVNE